jgi:peptide/nickel transport system permease protein
MTRRTKIAAALVFLGILHGFVIFAGFLAPYPYAEQHREFPYSPPTPIHWRLGARAPDAVFLLGTDAYGRDVFSRLLYGGRVSLFTGLLAAFLSLALGLALGTAAGFYGGWLDQLLMRGGELVMALPWLYLLLAVRAFLPLHITTVQAFFLLVAIIGAVGWVRPARLIRGVVLSARERGFVLAARGFGASNAYLIRRHILPLTLGVVLTQATVLIPQYILAEVALSFLGLGVGEPVPSWGNMLAEAQQYHALVEHWWMLAPGLAIIPVLLGYLLLADTLLEKGVRRIIAPAGRARLAAPRRPPPLR